MGPRSFFLLAALAAGTALVAAPTERVLHEAEWSTVDPGVEPAASLLQPEGTTRWDLRSLELLEPRTRRMVAPAGSGETIDLIELSDAGADLLRAVRYADVAQPGDASRWLFPQDDPMLLSTETDSIRFGRGPKEIRVDLRRVGMGWLLIPSGPREVILQRAWIRVDGEAGTGTLLHRWIDPREGEVARVWGPASPDGRRRAAVEGAEVVHSVSRGGSPLRLYLDQVDGEVCSAPPDICAGRLAYGYDRERKCTNNNNSCFEGSDCGLFGNCFLSLDEMVTPSTPGMTMGDLIALGAWDFTPTDSTNNVAVIDSTFTSVSPGQTCNSGNCGFVPGRLMGREDRRIEGSSEVRRINSVTERDEPPGGPATLWMRAGTVNEGLSGGILGTTESRLCYDPTAGFTPVPLWQFQQQDAEGWYMELGDAWSSAPFNCEQNISVGRCDQNCPDVLFCVNYAGAVPASGYAGTNSNQVVAEGPVTLPSGHIFQALVVRNTSEFGVWQNSACSGNPLSFVRTVVYLWQVPYLGTVARLMSPQNASGVDSFTQLAETDIKFGLFPPVAISVTGTADNTVDLSWNPGSETDRITDYRVHWGPTSGADASYSGLLTQPAVAGTTATIGGLVEGTEYFFTVTSLADFDNPSTAVVTTYESLIFPLTVTASGGGSVPVEVSAQTTCTSGVPPVEVTGVTVNKPGGTDVEICWDASPNGCVTTYEVLGATMPELAGDFSVLVSDTGGATCTTLSNPSESYFLVRTKGTGGTGPLGHFGQ